MVSTPVVTLPDPAAAIPAWRVAAIRRPSFSMLGWALDEEQAIEAYVERAGAFLATLTDDYELILLDDGSSDRTWAVMRRCQSTRPWLRIFQNEGTRGSGYNAARAISLATKDYLFWQTVDWAYDVSVFVGAIGLLATYDIVQGVRSNALTLAAVVSRRSDSPYKGFVSYVNYRLIRVLFRLPISDYQNVTIYPTRLIQGIQLESRSSFTNAECLLKTWWLGATFTEVPVPFMKRASGIGKGTRPRAIVTAIADIVYWWVQWIVLGRRDRRGAGSVVSIEHFREGRS
jgi:glycosyltransferase involved in cell wall biosynthesis